MNRLQSKLEKIGRDPKVTARAVGLRYAANLEKGYHRVKSGDGFHYLDENRRKVRNKAVLERFKKLVIPPAWENVWISPYENGHLQVTGIDAKGRKQYRYHAHWNKIRNQSKFHRLQQFATALPLIREQVDKDLDRKGLPYEKVVALVVRLIELTNIRIGNDAYKKLYGSFGLTTLQDKHVTFDKSNLYFQFVGKKGVKHNIGIRSMKLLNLVKKCRDIPGQDLFQYYDDDGRHHVIGSADINNYLKNITQQDFTAKDFRVWAGSVNALCAFQSAGEPKNDSDCKHKIVEVIDSVAKKLGNTRSVCRKYYVHPTVIAAYEKGSIWKYKPVETSPALNEEERTLISLLENETIAEVIA
ncbi:DNA topoisomerase I [Flavobacterium magnum]|uniref:DNA topoisomerase n=1 Tax=Flavobacterium magnum TaxID=2162713 RepID=A0A2S0RI44_9FLAO|nr:DNA topoisomerase IB [Flavobacterium magnum]AWA30888.1 DNA topoisomerase I [Flavobacterium magnum]